MDHFCSHERGSPHEGTAPLFMNIPVRSIDNLSTNFMFISGLYCTSKITFGAVGYVFAENDKYFETMRTSSVILSFV